MLVRPGLFTSVLQHSFLVMTELGVASPDAPPPIYWIQTRPPNQSPPPSLEVIRRDLVARVYHNRLHAVAVLQQLLKQVVVLITNQAKKEFDELRFLNEFRMSFAPDVPAVSLQSLLQTAPLPDSSDRQAVIGQQLMEAAGSGEKMAVVASELHQQVISIIDDANMMRKRRLLVMSSLWADLEGKF